MTQYFSYSGYRSYVTCPRKYYFQYVAREPVLRDPKPSLFGSIIGKVFEWFYEDRLWADPDPVSAACAKIGRATDSVCRKEGFVLGSDPAFAASLKSDLEKFVPAGVETVRSHRLLSENSHAEVDLTVTTSKDGTALRLGKRADFIHWMPGGSWILDGKGSAKRHQYADPDQLVWYALLHYLKYGFSPSRLGFIFWRFPDDPVQWIDYDASSLRSVHSRAFQVAEKVRLQVFDPVPSTSCKVCDFRSKCDVGTRHVAELRVKSAGRIESSIFDLDFI
jgi:hypothetical protein